MKKLFFLGLLIFFYCKSPLTPEEEIEMLQDTLIGKWETPEVYFVERDSSYTFRYLRFGEETFEHTVKDTHGLWAADEGTVKGNYTVDSKNQLSITIKETDGNRWCYGWKVGEILFWDVELINENKLKFCFLPDETTPKFYEFSRVK